MSKLICASAIDGAIGYVARAEKAVNKAIAEKVNPHKYRFPIQLILFL